MPLFCLGLLPLPEGEGRGEGELPSLHHPPLLLRQSVERVHLRVNLGVQFLDALLERVPPVVQRVRRLRVLLVQFQHLRHELDDLVVLALLGGVGEVDAADGELAHILLCAGNPATSENIAGLFEIPKLKL